jgi:hypothetical protein
MPTTKAKNKQDKQTHPNNTKSSDKSPCTGFSPLTASGESLFCCLDWYNIFVEMHLNASLNPSAFLFTLIPSKETFKTGRSLFLPAKKKQPPSPNPPPLLPFRRQKEKFKTREGKWLVGGNEGMEEGK